MIIDLQTKLLNLASSIEEEAKEHNEEKLIKALASTGSLQGMDQLFDNFKLKSEITSLAIKIERFKLLYKIEDDQGRPLYQTKPINSLILKEPE